MRKAMVAAVVTMVMVATAAQAGLMVSLSDVETDETWTCMLVGEVRELYGGSIVELGPVVPYDHSATSLQHPYRLFGAEYREVLRQTGVETLAHREVWWRVDRQQGRKPLTIVDGIRMGIADPKRIVIGQ
jgi:hypothetical protein